MTAQHQFSSRRTARRLSGEAHERGAFVSGWTSTAGDLIMTYLEVAKQYLDAWNAHDADAIVDTFAEDGTYCDPTTGNISGDAIGTNAKRLWSAFPDLSFEIASIAEAGAGRVVVEWIMKGTNTESFQGLPPTGRSISLLGVDVIKCLCSRSRSVHFLLAIRLRYSRARR
jgi:steroid delta-isomerase-like uncharacterized protein